MLVGADVGEHIMNKTSVKVDSQRHYAPHHLLFAIASTALEDAESDRPGKVHYITMAITFSALALEALANSFGERFLKNWPNIERKSTIEKFVAITKALALPIDINKEPWSTAVWLANLRNAIVHAKPEHIHIRCMLPYAAYVAYEKQHSFCPNANLEKQLTIGNARRATKQARSIKYKLLKVLPSKHLEGLLADGWCTHYTYESQPCDTSNPHSPSAPVV